MAKQKVKKAKKVAAKKAVKKKTAKVVKKKAIKAKKVSKKKATSKKVVKKKVTKSAAKKTAKKKGMLKSAIAKMKNLVSDKPSKAKSAKKKKTTATAKVKSKTTGQASKSVKPVKKAKAKTTATTAKKAVKASKPKSSTTHTTKSAAKPASTANAESRGQTQPKTELIEETIMSTGDVNTSAGSLGFTPYQPKEGEEYMETQQRAHFRNILTRWKEQIMQEVDNTVGHMKEDVMAYADPLDRAAQEEGFSLELRTRDRERKLLKKIEKALDLIDQGDYGFCEDCGAEIGIRRLEARPTAEKCIDCKTFEEIREKQAGG